MTKGNNVPALTAVLVPLWLFVLGVTWKSSHLRGDIASRWSSRVGLAVASLTERAANSLLALTDIIGIRLGGLSEPFDPDALITDPADLVESAEQFQQAIRDRDRLRYWYDSQVRLAPFAILLSVPLVLATALQSTYLLHSFGPTNSVRVRGALVVAWTLLGLAAIGLGTRYIYLEQRISGAELRSKE